MSWLCGPQPASRFLDLALQINRKFVQFYDVPQKSPRNSEKEAKTPFDFDLRNGGQTVFL